MFVFKNVEIRRVVVVGSGQIGPDIALYFAKLFAPRDVPVVVVDVADDALARGRERSFAKIDKGVSSGAFTADAAATMKSGLIFTSNYEDARGGSLVVEAASENLVVKRKVFAQLESLCSPDAVFASNSSHLEPEEIFSELSSRNRGLVVHYFFPAERNPIVEVVPAQDTGPAVTRWTMDFYEWMGKVPVQISSRYGYAVDPVFEGIFQAAVLCVEEGLGTVKQVDTVAREALRLGVGPFTAMNLTGGNPITHHGLSEMHSKIMPWFSPPQLLSEALETKSPWEVASRGESVDVDDDARRAITERMRGAYFGLVCEILDSGIAEVGDLELAVENALVVGGPFKMMNKSGLAQSLSLVETYAAGHSGFKVSTRLLAQAQSGRPWEISVIVRENHGGVAVLKIRRPAVLNAIDASTMAELRSTFTALDADAGVQAVVLTGFGRKAFVSGADIGFLSGLENARAAEEMCRNFQGAIDAIAGMSKPVVCAMNGIAFGGGCEIAMGCHARIAPAAMKVLAGQPEVNLGIIPGAGGTQRLPRIVGFDVANEMLRTGKPISSPRALEIGLVDRLSDADLIEDAVRFASELVAGKSHPRKMPIEPLSPPDHLSDVDLGHLSRAVDRLLSRAILEGAGMTLADGLRHEARLFGEVSETDDARIGIRNFIENGPRSKASFVHR